MSSGEAHSSTLETSCGKFLEPLPSISSARHTNDASGRKPSSLSSWPTARLEILGIGLGGGRYSNRSISIAECLREATAEWKTFGWCLQRSWIEWRRFGSERHSVSTSRRSKPKLTRQNTCICSLMIRHIFLWIVGGLFSRSQDGLMTLFRACVQYRSKLSQDAYVRQ
jgi:hypothetical protein